MSKIIFIFCLITFHPMCAQYSNFSLEGKTSDMEDGSYLYFRDLVNGGTLDSALVKNNSFRFDTELPEPAVFVMLHTNDQKIFTEVWLEDNPMFFDASNGDFKKAKITGSKNQSLFEELHEEVWADYFEVDSAIIKQREMDFIRRNPDAIVSAFLLFSNPLWNQNQIGEFYSSLSEEVRYSSIGQKKVAAFLEKDLPEPGDSYIDLSISNSEGEIMKISDITGKLTLLQFWDSNCAPSRIINSTLTDVYKKYHQEGLEIISISKDTDKESWLGAIKEDELNWPNLSSLQGWNGEGFKAYGVSATPANFLINSKGLIIERNLKRDEIENKIRKHLEK